MPPPQPGERRRIHAQFPAAARPAVVTGHAEGFQVKGQRQRPHQVCRKEQASVEQHQQRQIGLDLLRLNIRSQFRNSRADLLLREEDALNVFRQLMFPRLHSPDWLGNRSTLHPRCTC